MEWSWSMGEDRILFDADATINVCVAIKDRIILKEATFHSRQRTYCGWKSRSISVKKLVRFRNFP